jgi:tetratricopeptide (TPR) repeat protein
VIAAVGIAVGLIFAVVWLAGGSPPAAAPRPLANPQQAPVSVATNTPVAQPPATATSLPGPMATQTQQAIELQALGDRYQQGEAAYNKEDWAAAITQFEAAFKANPAFRDVKGKLYAAYTNRGLGDYRKAEQAFLAGQFSSADAYLRSARTALESALRYDANGGEAKLGLQSIEALFPRLTPTPTPLPTATPRPTATPVLARNVQIDIINNVNAVITIALTGPYVETYTVAPFATRTIYMPSGTYSYIMTALGFTPNTGIKSWDAGTWTWTLTKQ